MRRTTQACDFLLVVSRHARPSDFLLSVAARVRVHPYHVRTDGEDVSLDGDRLANEPSESRSRVFFVGTGPS